ncbi:hypothetical protein ACROYT_G024765 [Oculina patagonica]
MCGIDWADQNNRYYSSSRNCKCWPPWMDTSINNAFQLYKAIPTNTQKLMTREFRMTLATSLMMSHRTSQAIRQPKKEPITVLQRQYVEDYYTREEIRLYPANVKKNPGLRVLAKMMLSSMWVKFGQKPSKTQVREFDDPVAFNILNVRHNCDVIIIMKNRHGDDNSLNVYGTAGAGVTFIGNKSTVKASEDTPEKERNIDEFCPRAKFEEAVKKVGPIQVKEKEVSGEDGCVKMSVFDENDTLNKLAANVVEIVEQDVDDEAGDLIETDKEEGDIESETEEDCAFVDDKVETEEDALFCCALKSYDMFLKANECHQTKGFFLYKWMDFLDKTEDLSLAPHESLFSTLKNENITGLEYQYFQQVWSKKQHANIQRFPSLVQQSRRYTKAAKKLKKEVLAGVLAAFEKEEDTFKSRKRKASNSPGEEDAPEGCPLDEDSNSDEECDESVQSVFGVLGVKLTNLWKTNVTELPRFLGRIYLTSLELDTFGEIIQAKKLQDRILYATYYGPNGIKPNDSSGMKVRKIKMLTSQRRPSYYEDLFIAKNKDVVSHLKTVYAKQSKSKDTDNRCGDSHWRAANNRVRKSAKLDETGLEIAVKMPKSILTLKNQIANCEESIQESLGLCADESGDINYKLDFSLEGVINSLTTIDLDAAIEAVFRALHVLNQCEKIFNLEKKRRKYSKEIRRRLKAKEHKQTLQRLTMKNKFEMKSKPFVIPNMKMMMDKEKKFKENQMKIDEEDDDEEEIEDEDEDEEIAEEDIGEKLQELNLNDEELK